MIVHPGEHKQNVESRIERAVEVFHPIGNLFDGLVVQATEASNVTETTPQSYL
jgi:hypothetical protein